jgi:predicted O-linked N-acetylglucosamine transferase (SPINDLY family)
MTEVMLTLPEAIKRAVASHHAGDLTGAEQIYQKIIAAKPDHFDANHLLGLLRYQCGHHEEAERLIRLALATNPEDPAALCNLGAVLRELKQPDDALASFDKAIALQSDYADAHYNRGNTLKDLNRPEEAIESYGKAIAFKPNYAKAYNNRGISLQRLKRLDEALASYENAITLRPDDADAYYNRGNTLTALRLLDQAVASYDKAIALKPGYAKAHKNRGIALQHLMRLDEAIVSYDRAIALEPDNAEAFIARGITFRHLKRLDDALASFDQAIRCRPDNAEAHYHRGNTLSGLRRPDEALISYDNAIALTSDAPFYNNRAVALNEMSRSKEALLNCDKAIELNPIDAKAHNNRAVALIELNRNQEALECCERAIALNPNYTDAHNNRGFVLKILGRHDDALGSFEKVISLEPSYDFAYGAWAHTKMQMCDWRGYGNLIAHLAEKLERAENAVQPFQILGLSDAPGLQRTTAEIWVRAKCPPNNAIAKIPKRQKRDKLRIGYYSADFRKHPLAFLMAELFERHCRSQFEVIALSFGSDTGDFMRQRLEAAFDRFIDVRGQSDRDVALLSRELGIDIAVDLGGFTTNSRPNIFSMRAAPIQVSYLGYPGTMGAEYIDYLIADQTLIPEPDQKYYAEKIAYLPDTYLVNDSTRPIADRTFTRAELGLPKDAFVFCCFNNNWKITPEIFDCWMRLLERISGSVLWLLEDNATAARNLRTEAENRGIDSDRLIFAQRIPVAEHLARHRVADLFLDTLPYNAHTTASEALWCGLPVLTRIGDAFAGRVAASLLNAIGLSELITTTPEAYDSLAIELATKPETLSEIRRKLASNRLTTPLFDTQLFTKHIEAAYTSMYELYQADLGPDHIYVPRRPLG